MARADPLAPRPSLYLLQNIVGEVWSVDRQKLKFLDDFEAYPSYYDRVKIDVHLLPTQTATGSGNSDHQRQQESGSGSGDGDGGKHSGGGQTGVGSAGDRSEEGQEEGRKGAAAGAATSGDGVRLKQEDDAGQNGAARVLRPMLYIMKTFKAELLNLPFYSDYDSYASHNMPYVERLNIRTGETEASHAILEISSHLAARADVL